MSTIMKDLKLSPLFQRNMMTYIMGIMLTQLQRIELQYFMNLLAPSLKREVIYQLFRTNIKSPCFLKSIRHDLHISQKVELLYTVPEETIFKYDSEAKGMYFIIRGEVELKAPRLSDGGFKSHKFLKIGDSFGEIGLLLNTSRTLQA